MKHPAITPKSVTHVPAADTAATQTIAAATSDVWALYSITAGYDSVASGTLTVVAGTTTIFTCDVNNTAEDRNPVHLVFPVGLSRGVINEAYTITLTSGGGGIKGRITATYF